MGGWEKSRMTLFHMPDLTLINLVLTGVIIPLISWVLQRAGAVLAELRKLNSRLVTLEEWRRGHDAFVLARTEMYDKQIERLEGRVDLIVMGHRKEST